MSTVEKHYYLHQVFKARGEKSEPLIPVSRTTGNRMIDELVALGEIPDPPRVAGRKMLPQSSVEKLILLLHQGVFADLRVNQSRSNSEKTAA